MKIKPLTFEKAVDLARLHDELLAAVPELAGTYTEQEELKWDEGQVEAMKASKRQELGLPPDAEVDVGVEAGDVREVAVFELPKLRVEGDASELRLCISDDVDEAAVRKVVSDHDPNAPLPPGPPDPYAEMKTIIDGAQSLADIKQLSSWLDVLAHESRLGAADPEKRAAAASEKTSRVKKKSRSKR